MFQAKILSHVMNKFVQADSDLDHQQQYDLLIDKCSQNPGNVFNFPDGAQPLASQEFMDIDSMVSLIDEEIGELTILVEELSSSTAEKVITTDEEFQDVFNKGDGLYRIQLPVIGFINYEGMFRAYANDYSLDSEEHKLKCLQAMLALTPQLPMVLVNAILEGNSEFIDNSVDGKYVIFNVTVKSEK